mgnify:CR=1 FL=1
MSGVKYTQCSDGILRAHQHGDWKEVESCIWTPEELHGHYTSACGNGFVFSDGDVRESKWTHCPYCGGELVIPSHVRCEECGQWRHKNEMMDRQPYCRGCI